MRILAGLGSVAVGVTIAVGVLLINGGYIYRTKCPLASGSTQTHWTYGIDDILPYIRSTSPPCKSHTGTRLLLSAAGIAPLHDGDSATDTTPITPEDEAAAEALARATTAITVEYDRERREGAPIQAEVKSQGLTPEIRQKFASMMTTAMGRFLAIKTRLDRSVAAGDPLLAEANRLLSLWLGREIQIDRVFFTSNSKSDLDRNVRAIAMKIAPISSRLATLSVEIQAKYPNVTDWGFLPNG